MKVPAKVINTNKLVHSMLFELLINLDEGVEIQDCIVKPSRHGVFHFCIINHTVQTIVLPKGTIVGTLDELYDLRQSSEEFKDQPDAVYAIWQIPAHQVGTSQSTHQEQVKVPLVLDQGVGKERPYIYQVSGDRADVVQSDRPKKKQGGGSEHDTVPKSCFHLFTSGDHPPRGGSPPAHILGISKGEYTSVEQEVVDILPEHMRCMLPPSGILGVEHLERVANLIIEYQDVFGLFEWLVMPFGLCNAPATFCRLMEKVLADICWSKCLVYLDDVLSFGRDFTEALWNLRLILERFRRANLRLKPKKCELFRTHVEYLGHEVSAEGIRPSANKVSILSAWLEPISQTEVRTFRGFCSYYRHFLKNFAAMAKPLYDLTCKGVRVPIPLTEM
ncbi:MAG: RNA-directed DNA polymerase, partial [Actinomycetia bacterium]|nr:RNA-directed DNA polymerase [Actinomycetes bacterium]